MSGTTTDPTSPGDEDARRAAARPPRPAQSRRRLTPEELRARREQWLAGARAALPGAARAYLEMTIGCIVMAAGYSYFLIPQKIAPGGVYGIATVLHYASDALLGRALPTGMIGLVLNVPLFVWGLRTLGMRFAARTVFGIIVASAAIDLLDLAVAPLGWDATLAGLEPMLAAIFGGLLLGAGLGIIFRNMGSTGGTDIVGQILGRKTNISVGVWMMIVDACVVIGAAYYFRDVNLSLYAVVTIFVTGRVIDTVLEGQSRSRAVTIISDEVEPIRDAILFGLDRTATIIEATGLYGGRRKHVIYCVVNRK
ncbi:MAG: YitT family protein, partial [Candidatus Eiseniibacteriota bacterium]